MVGRAVGIVPVLGLLLAVPAVAGPSDVDRAAQLEQRREKLRQKWERQFREADTDQSRKLSPAEIEAARLPRRMLEHFADIDRDHDGGLSPEELLAAQNQRVRDASAPSAVSPPSREAGASAAGP